MDSTKIRRLNRLKNYRIFRDFSWPAGNFPDFARFNVIYGWNGSGKTSLSNLFRHIQLRTPLTDGDVEVLLQGNVRVSGKDFAAATLPNIRVFNRDTVGRSVFEIPGQRLPPVYFIGEDSVDKQKRIESLKLEVAKASDEVVKLAGTKSAAESAFESFCTSQARGIKNLLTIAGGGPYNNYDARRYKTAASDQAGENKKTQPLSDEDRQRYLGTKDGRAMEPLPVPSFTYPDLAALTNKVDSSLKRSLVSAVLPELDERPDVAAWVADGLELHTDAHDTDTCRFCGQMLPFGRIEELQAHFSDEFKTFRRELDTLTADIQSALSAMSALELPPKQALYPHLHGDYEAAANSAKSQASTVSFGLKVLQKAVSAKKDEPFRPLELLQFVTRSAPADQPVGGWESFFQFLLGGIALVGSVSGKTSYDNAVRLIESHNLHTANFGREVALARAALEKDEVRKGQTEWKSKQAAISKAATQLTAATDRDKQLRKEIAELEAQVLEHHRSADELNREMAAYLGRDELRFEVEQTGYRITRNGHPALHLSEGERTAIAFMYFLKSLAASDFDLKHGIVVIDDPVSSLDSNSLYSAFGFMKQRTKDAGQLFILTHNFTFFRQVRNWFSHLPGQKKSDVSLRPARFYMLSSTYEGATRTSTIGLLDPFLYEYESEYHYLFKRIHDETQRPPGRSMESYYEVPNITRRLLEAFLAFRFPNITGDLSRKLDEVSFDAAEKARILRFLHTYSHSDHVLEPAHDVSVLSETPAILKSVMELIQNTDGLHYEKMLSLVNFQDKKE